jgi:hypothetical protein
MERRNLDLKLENLKTAEIVNAIKLGRLILHEDPLPEEIIHTLREETGQVQTTSKFEVNKVKKDRTKSVAEFQGMEKANPQRDW